jgi:hypothetical protein
VKLKNHYVLKGAAMRSDNLWRLSAIIVFALLFGLSSFSVAQDKKDKVLSKDLSVTTLKITGID